MKNQRPKKRAAPPKGKIIPDNKPENGYKKRAKVAIKSRIAAKNEGQGK